MKYKIVTLLVIIFVFIIFTVATVLTGKKVVGLKLNQSLTLPILSEEKGDTISYSAWIPSWMEKQSVLSIKGFTPGQIDEINPVWYEVDQNGNIVKSNSIKTDLLEVATSKKIRISPTITNITPNGFDPERVSLLINNKSLVIKEMIKIAQDNGYSGWDLDLEEIRQSDKESYSEFVKELSSNLNDNNLTLSVTVHAQSGDNDWNGTKGQDIQSLGMYADNIRVMAYDFHNSNSDAGAITPSTNLVETIKYTLEEVDLKKVTMCLPTYGYNWSDEEVVPMQFIDIKMLVENELIRVERDPESYELTGKYIKDGVKHTIWYQDAISMQEKVKIVKQYGITKVCFWHLGGEDQDFWQRD